MARILLVAPTCDGDDVGEAWVAYQWARGLSERHQVTLLTYHKRGRRPAREQVPGARVVEWEEPRGLARFERLNSMLKPAYFVFHRRAVRWIKQARQSGEVFDVVHQPVPVATRYPSPGLAAGAPLLVGPVGGGLPDPSGFTGRSGSTPWFVRLRALDQLRLRWDPWLRRTYARAACVLVIAPYVEERLREAGPRRVEVMSETALERLPDRVHERGDGEDGAGPVRLLFVGRLVETKAPDLLVEAVARCRDLAVVCDIVGEGPEDARCRLLIDEHGLDDVVTMHGRLPRSTVDDFYRRADVFVFPSYREPGGNVVFEAMGFELPLIVCDRGGPGAATDDECAIRIPVSTPEALVEDLAAGIRALAGDGARRHQMGAAARRRVEQVGLWSGKLDHFDR